jgi:hypothetical protein
LTGHYAFAFIVLGYLAVPLLAYLVYWLFKKFRRAEPAEGEGEGET